MAKRKKLHQNKSGHSAVRHGKGNRIGGSFQGCCRTCRETEKNAERAPAEKGAKSREGENMDPLSFFCDSWLLACSTRLKPSTLAKYRADIENHIKPVFGDRIPDQILSEEIEAFTRMLLNEKQLSVKTVRGVLTMFHSILSYIKKRAGDDFREPEIAYPKARRKNAKILDEREESALLELLAHEMNLDKFGIYLAMRTGIRIGEVCALRWCDISPEEAVISICHTAQRLPRQSRTSAESLQNRQTRKTALVIGSPKSDSSQRQIPLMPDIAFLCERFRCESPEAFVLTGTSKCMDPRKLQRRLKKYLEECEIREAHFHTLRHTFATRCVEAGFDMKTLSEILGHSSIGITMNQYVHPNMDLKRANMSRLKAGYSRDF